MSTNLLVSQENRLNWDMAFKVVSIDKCLSLLYLSGIPAIMLEHSSHLTDVARNYVRSQYLRSHTSVEAALEYQYFCISEAFTQLKNLYSSSAAEMLHQWFSLFILDISLSRGWDSWGSIFYRVYRSNECNFYQLSPSLQYRISACINIEQYRQTIRQLRQQIEAAKLAPQTEWENWLEKKAANGAGDKYNIGDAEARLDQVELIVQNSLIQQALKRIRQTLTSSEQTEFLQWAYLQSEEVGHPGQFIDLAWSECLN